jgi:mRNA-degrading endonuclease toxin of MazEF toxin-antitoxin module
MEIERGEIWWINIDPAVGSEIKNKSGQSTRSVSLTAPVSW